MRKKEMKTRRETINKTGPCATNSSGGDVERISNIDEFRVGLQCHQVYMTQWTHHDSSLVSQTCL